MKYFQYYILFIIVILLSGCYEEIPTEEIQGYWKTEPYSAKPNFEFFNGTTVESSDMTLRTGRIEQKDKPVELFYWEKDAEGDIVLSVVSGDCPTRPLTTCPTIANVKIQSIPTEKNRYLWNISYDYLDDATTDVTYQSIYRKKGLRFKRLSDGEIYLNSAKNLAFASPYFAQKTGNEISIWLEVLDSVIDVSADFSSDRQAKILHFNANEEVTSSTVTQFPAFDGGTVTLDVVSTLSSVTMVASKRRNSEEGSSPNGNYVLSWVINKNIEFPDDISPESVDVSGFTAEERFSQVLELFDSFIYGPQLAQGDLYFTHFPSNFLTFDGFANEVHFSNSSTGTVAFTNAIDETFREEKSFEWQQGFDGKVNLHFDDTNVSTTMRFLSEIDGGYRVLFGVPDAILGIRYFIRDFIVSSDTVLDQFSLPGVYTVRNTTSKPNGSFLFDVIFNDDGTVDGDLSGFWFENLDGSIQSYECYDLIGFPIDDYLNCLEAIENNSFSFIWIRKISFIHQEEDQFKAKYNSVIITADFPLPLNFAWTYRFTRISD